MKLEVGKKYKTRAGDTVIIENFNKDDDYPFKGVLLSSSLEDAQDEWNENGRFYGFTDSALDLIEEVSEMVIDLNKSYVTRNGSSVKLFSVQGHPSYPVIGIIGNNVTPSCWKLDGSYDKGKEPHNWDLVEDTPYKDFQIDEPVYYAHQENGTTYKALFAGVSPSGKPLIHSYGNSWVGGHTCEVFSVFKPSSEELKK